jgi:hypothetical protein
MKETKSRSTERKPPAQLIKEAKPGVERRRWDDVVNHPSYYNSGSIEVIDFIEDQQLGFHLGNAVKYIARAGKKSTDSVQIALDAEKAIWYLKRFIQIQR